MKRYFRWFLALLVLVFHPIILLAAVLLLVLTLGTIGGWHASWEWNTIQKEVTAYVLEHKDTIERNTPHEYRSFVYTYTPTFDGGIEFGYYYSEDNKYTGDTSKMSRYRKGYRTDNVRGDPCDWYYVERICEKWFYYEDHDG